MISDVYRRDFERGQFPVFQVVLFERVLMMDPEGFFDWMGEQTWPRDSREAAPQVLLPTPGSLWQPVRFDTGRVRAGLVITAFAGDRVLYTCEGAVISIVAKREQLSE